MIIFHVPILADIGLCYSLSHNASQRLHLNIPECVVGILVFVCWGEEGLLKEGVDHTSLEMEETTHKPTFQSAKLLRSVSLT